MSRTRSFLLRRSLLLLAGILTSVSAVSAQEFSYKGIRLGMTIEEFRDTMTSNSYFAKPTAIRDYFGNEQPGLDSMTQEVQFYEQIFPVGVKVVAGDTSVVSYDNLYITFLRSRIVAIRLFCTAPFVDDLISMSTDGLVSKLGKASIDNRNDWKDGYDDAITGDRVSVVRWNKKAGKDSTFVGVVFIRTKKDYYSELFGSFHPILEVQMYAALKSPELQAWYDSEMKQEVERQYEEKYGTKTDIDF